MSHQCVKCGKMYQNGSDELLKGCACGGKFFFYIKEENLSVKEEIVKLSSEDKEKIEDEVREIIGDPEKEKPVILDFESVKIIKPGQFEIDLPHLFNKQPLVYKLEEGKYIIDVASSFQLKKKK